MSLLVLFLLMGVTFVVVSGQYKDGAIAAAKYRLVEEDPRKLPDTVIYQLLRDVPATSLSSLKDQSLLADLYGNDGVRVVVAARSGSGASNYSTPRYENDSVQGVDSEFIGMVVRPGNNPLSQLEDYYCGRVITILTGRASGLSTRIVDDLSFTPGPDGGWGRFGVDDDGNGTTDDISEAFAANSDDQRLLRMEALPSDTGSGVLPEVGDEVLINGQAFNGAGYGYDGSTGNIDSVLWLRGADRAWGTAGTDDDSNGIVDDSTEAGFGDDTFANTTLPLALFSHRTTPPTRGIFGTHAARLSSTPGSNLATSVSAGGADETWDAVDFQNNFMAYIPTDLSGVGQIIPSFHRPSLVTYVYGQLVSAISSLTWTAFVQPYGPDNTRGTADDPSALTLAERDLIVDVKRACIFRPLPEDHPTFTGSNGSFNLAGNAPATGFGTNGTWDVDNDGDGVADSVWIDIGLPVKTAEDGRVYKPLVAILCRDLDGRININAHGSLDLLPTNLQNTYEWHPGYDGAWGRSGVDDDGMNGVDDIGERGWVNSDDRRIAGARTFNRFEFPRGSGYGPAEISLLPLVSGSTTAASTIMGTRYQRANSAASLQPAGSSDNRDDEIDLVRNFGMPYDFLSTRSSYAMPPDLRGRGAYGLDRLGQPIMSSPGPDGRWGVAGVDDDGNGATDDISEFAYVNSDDVVVYMGLAQDKVDDPYENILDIEKITGGGPGDLLFTLAEMERLLRPYDVDSAKLPSRLFDIAPSGFLGGARNMLTVHSSHIPVPISIFPPEGRVGSLSPSIVDLYATKINATKATSTVTQDQLNIMMPFEFRRGQRFDLNRPFGNGRDEGDGADNNMNGFIDEPAEIGIDSRLNGVVDEPSEEVAGQYAWISDAQLPVNSRLPGSSNFLNATFNHNNDSLLSVSSRANYARHLYCLMMMIIDQSQLHPFIDPATPLTQMEREALTAKRIAQWAVNVVDFRDPDSIMTPFEYDIYPLAQSKGPDGEWGVAGVDDDGNLTIDDISEAQYAGSDDIAGGWKVDGNLGTIEPASYRGVVWGCEQPELLLTETFALHDRRVRDTDLDDGRNTGDPNYPNPEKKRDEVMDEDSDADQYRLPQGSAFFELYCARNPNNSVVPRELYNANGQLDLGRLAPQRAFGMANVRHPVWRIAIASGTNPRTLAYGPAAAREEERVSFDPVEMGLTLDRYVWFSPNDPAGSPEEGRVFYGQGGTITPPTVATNQATSNVQVAPSRYVVVGPRATTATGLQIIDSDGDPKTVDLSTQQLSLVGSTFTATGTGATYPTVGTDIQPPVSVICAAKPPTTWVNQARRVGLNVSEPLPSGAYYREPLASTPDLYFDYDNPIITDPADPAYNALPDQPFDENPAYPLAGDVQTQTRMDFRSAFLQRLADPTLPWNPYPSQTGYDSTLAVNPYITTDWSSVDLTVFNGDEVSHEVPMAGSGTWTDDNDRNPLRHNAGDPRERFETRQRNGVKFNIWSQRTGDPQLESNGTKTRGAVDHFPYALAHTLGFLNNGLNTGYASSTPPSTPQTSANHIGGPARPFPWLTWNDRPFASPFELLLAPTSSPSRLLYEFVAPGVTQDTISAGDHPFVPNPTVDPFDSTGSGVNSFRSPYGHLMNFFRSDATGTAAGNFSRLFDFVETPSPFAGTEKWYNPVAFASGTSGVEFRPPYNKLSRFRDPGRINLNTSGLFVGKGADGEWGYAGVDDDGDGFIDNEREALWTGSDDVYEGAVWEAIAKHFPAMDPSILWHPGPDGAWGVAGVDDDGMNGVDDVGEAGWSNASMDSTDDSDDFRPVRTLIHLIETMQGTGSYPTVIANPLRAAMSADLMPAISDMRKNSVEATLLRSHPVAPTTPAPHPLEPTSTDPLFFTYSELNQNDTRRNAYFRNQGLTRLSNLLTSQSNVYATWVTVGFFEVEGNPGADGLTGTADDVDVVHPDGYRLTQELGLETGEVNRHRAFYLIDRSIPVAFEPGENHNVDRAILLRRFIE